MPQTQLTELISITQQLHDVVCVTGLAVMFALGFLSAVKLAALLPS